MSKSGLQIVYKYIYFIFNKIDINKINIHKKNIYKKINKFYIK